MFTNIKQRWDKFRKDRGPIAHPLTIARRLIAFPLMYASRALLAGSVALGWGLYEAADIWERTE